MKQGLSLKFAQNLSLTPALQQAIKLLQLSQQELLDVLNAQVENNPFLELGAAPNTAELSTAGGLLTISNFVDSSAAGMQTGPLTQLNKQNEALSNALGSSDDQSQHDWDDTASSYERTSPAPRDSNDEQDAPFSWVEAAAPTLLAHLQQQTRLLHLPPATSYVLNALLETLTPEGYLEPSTEPGTSAAGLAASLDVAHDAAFDKAYSAALQALRRLDPPGVGACDVQQCLQLQLTHPCPLDPVLDAKLPVFKLNPLSN